MFWAADANGRLASVTTHDRSNAQGVVMLRSRDGTGSQVIAAVRTLLHAVLHTRSGGATSYRIEANGVPTRVQVEANIALSPDDGSFAGYIGSVHLAPEALLPTETMVDADLARVMFLDVIADHIAQARILAVRADERRIVKILDLALMSIGDQLVQADRD